MTESLSQERAVLEWGWARSIFEGTDCGDVCVIVPFPNGALAAVIDGLGHGRQAAVAANAAARILEAHASEPVVSLIELCNAGLRPTRGAVMNLASFNKKDSSMTWVGVGNVEGLLIRSNQAERPSREAITSRGGVVGYQLPSLRAVTLPVSSGDTLIMATDGIRNSFASGFSMHRSPQNAAELILANCAKGSDDALVLVARYCG